MREDGGRCERTKDDTWDGGDYGAHAEGTIENIMTICDDLCRLDSTTSIVLYQQYQLFDELSDFSLMIDLQQKLSVPKHH